MGSTVYVDLWVKGGIEASAPSRPHVQLTELLRKREGRAVCQRREVGFGRGRGREGERESETRGYETFALHAPIH